MSTQEKVSLTLSINKEYRDRLRTMAAQQNLNDPDQLTSASTLAREIICDHINKMECHENGVKKVDQDTALPAETELNKVFKSLPDKDNKTGEGEKNDD